MAVSLTIVTVFLLLGTGAVHGFEPGCSFINNQCMYNVRLGHQGQCDSSSATTSDASNTAYAEIRTELASLKKQVQALQLNSVDIVTVQTTLNQSESERAALTQKLAEKEVELSLTQQELSHLLNQAKSEIMALKSESEKAKLENLSLKKRLSESQRDFQTCQTALGVTTETPPQVTSSDDSGLVTYCSFNNGWCGFRNIAVGVDFHNMTSGSSYETGAKVEHSTGSKKGKYIGLNSVIDIENCKGSSCGTRTGIIISDVMQPANAYCMMFYYIMYGDDVQNLNVNVKIGGGEGYSVWSRDGNQGNKWLLGQVDLDYEYTAQNFRVEFSASTRAAACSYYDDCSNDYNTKADIGIDDVYIYNTTCSEVPRCALDAYEFKNPATNKTSCYTFHTVPKTWTDAFDVCRREGPTTGLVSINNEEEQTYLVNLIKSNAGLNAVSKNGFYTSGNDLHSEKTFRWADYGDMLNDVNYKNWHVRQPNNVGGNQNCLLMEYARDDYTWGDVVCGTAHPFICESKIE